MNELLDFYTHQGQKCPDFPQLAALKNAALADFTRLGFPTRHDEAWKYTSTDAFLKTRFELEIEPASAPVPDFPLPTLTFDMRGSASEEYTLPQGVIIQSWADALLMHAEKIAPYLGHILSHTNGFQAQNTAMLRDGLFIYIPKNVVMDKPLLLSNWQQADLKARYIRHLIVMESGSSLCLIEDYQGAEDVAYFTNTMTEVHLNEHASLKHYKIQREGRMAYHVGDLAVHQGEKSHFESHSFSMGGKWVRSDTHITFVKPYATCLMNGIYMTNDAQHVDHHTVVNHNVPHCSSEQDYKGMMTGHSRAVFNGTVMVAKDAQQTVAKQQNKNLLLSKETEIDTKPQLEIFADDVVCTHGATVGQLDDDALFYLATRGILEQDARQFLVQAFVEDNLRKMASEPLALWVKAFINQHLG